MGWAGMADPPPLQIVGRVAAQLWQGAQSTLQGFQSSIAHALHRNPQGRQEELGEKLVTMPKTSREAPNPKFAPELEPWRKNPTWADEKPILKVSVPQGALCQLNTIVKVGLPPSTVFDILSDPENKRVFKNIKEVRYRKILEDDGDRQVVEVEQAAIWRFLWLTGTLSVFVRVDQDRKALKLKYQLGKEGFMKRFQGSWSIEPLYLDANPGQGNPSEGRVASLLELHQVVEPAMMPPPPISWYVRGITCRSISNMLGDLQAECRRIRESPADDSMASPSLEATVGKGVGSKKTETSLLDKQGKLSDRTHGSTRRRQKNWRSRIVPFGRREIDPAEEL